MHTDAKVVTEDVSDRFSMLIGSEFQSIDLLHKSVKNQEMNLVLSVSICVHLWFLYLKLKFFPEV